MKEQPKKLKRFYKERAQEFVSQNHKDLSEGHTLIVPEGSRAKVNGVHVLWALIRGKKILAKGEDGQFYGKDK